MAIMTRKAYNSFSKIPLSVNFIVPFSVDLPTADAQCPYPNDTIMWWNGIQVGIGNRLTQITTQVYGTRPGYNEVWIRNKHDNLWSAWVKL